MFSWFPETFDGKPNSVKQLLRIVIEFFLRKELLLVVFSLIGIRIFYIYSELDLAEQAKNEATIK